jgi:hypothetical protein
MQDFEPEFSRVEAETMSLLYEPEMQLHEAEMERSLKDDLKLTI